jgi:hypothetical protein
MSSPFRLVQETMCKGSAFAECEEEDKEEISFLKEHNMKVEDFIKTAFYKFSKNKFVQRSEGDIEL